MNHAKPIRRIRNILLILTVSLLAVIATGVVAFADEDAAGAAWTAPAGDMRINLYDTISFPTIREPSKATRMSQRKSRN